MAVEATERQRLAAKAQCLAIEEAQMAAAAKRRDEAAAAEEERTRQEAAAALVLRDWLTAGCLRRQVCLMADDALNSRLRAAAAEEAAEAAAEVAEVCVDELLRAWVVEAMATWRCGKSGQRSAEAKRTRRRAAKRRRSSLKNGANGVDVASGGDSAEECSSDAAGREAALLHRALTAERALKDRTEVLALTRRQLRRETKTTKARLRQGARRESKAGKKLV